MRKESFTVFARTEGEFTCYYVAPCTVDEKNKVKPIKDQPEVPMFIVPKGLNTLFKSVYVGFSKEIGKAILDLYSDNGVKESVRIINGVVQQPTNDKSSTN